MSSLKTKAAQHISREIQATAVRRNTNLYELAKTMPEYGVGQRFTKIYWQQQEQEESKRVFPGPTFWTLTKILPKANGRTGHWAYGILTWKGRQRMTEEKITGTHKTVWKVVDEVREDGLDKRGMGDDGLKLALPEKEEEEEEGGGGGEEEAQK